MPSRTPAHRQDQSQSSEQRHRALLENALVGVYVNQDEKIAYANPKLAEMLGYEHDELIGMSGLEVVAPQNRALVHNKLQERISGKVKVDQYTFTALRKDGSTFPAEIFSSWVQFCGKPASQGIIMDITERVESQQLLQRLMAIATDILAETNSASILQRVCEALVEHSPFQVAAMSVFDRPVLPEEQYFAIEQLYITGVSEDQRNRLLDLKQEQRFIPNADVMGCGRAIGSCYLLTPELYPALKERGIPLKEDHWGAYDTLFLFLRQGERLLGRIALGQPKKGLLPSPDRLEPLALFANLAALAIHNARQMKTLKEQAIKDALTDLYNRHHFNEILEQEVQRAKRYLTPIAVLFVDVDDLHMINRDHGYLKGDLLLQAVAKLLKGMVRSSDWVFRYGGDEFVVLLPETDGQAQAVLERIQQAADAWQWPQCDFPMRLSIGLSHWEPASKQSLEQLIQQADTHMLAHKRAR